MDAPQTPLTGGGGIIGEGEGVGVGPGVGNGVSNALQEAGDPPFVPAHVQLQGPLPVTGEEAPKAQSPVVGITEKATSSEGPHIPFTDSGVLLAEQESVVPPCTPSQLHAQGPDPVTGVVCPVEHSPTAGIEENIFPLEDPQSPLIRDGVGGVSGGGAVLLALQLTCSPPLLP